LSVDTNFVGPGCPRGDLVVDISGSLSNRGAVTSRNRFDRVVTRCTKASEPTTKKRKRGGAYIFGKTVAIMGGAGGAPFAASVVAERKKRRNASIPLATSFPEYLCKCIFNKEEAAEYEGIWKSSSSQTHRREGQSGDFS
jgi:hypothetical protein